MGAQREISEMLQPSFTSFWQILTNTNMSDRAVNILSTKVQEIIGGLLISPNKKVKDCVLHYNLLTSKHNKTH